MAVPADEVAEAMGFGRKGMRWWRLIALCQIPLTAAALLGWAWESYTEPQVVPHIVWVDRDNMRVLATATPNNLTDREAVYVTVAKMWIWHLRSRSWDLAMNASNEREAQKYTSKRAYPQIKAMIDRVSEDLGCDKKECSDGIELGATIQALVRSIETDQAGNEFALVDVTWHERRYGKQGVGDPFGFYAKLRIMEAPPDRTGEVPPNPFGRYVVGYQFQETGKVGQFAEALP
jgi:type IV secretory pathway TrbF-like protein